MAHGAAAARAQSDRMRLSWLSAGWRMLKSTQPMAGVTTMSRRRPRLSSAGAAAAAASAASSLG